MKLKIGTRGSQLALWQAEYVKNRLKELDNSLEIELVTIKTTGDKILDAPLAKIGGKGLFTKEIEEALLRDEIDIAVHSLKDVPVILPDRLYLVAITKREDVRDLFLSEKYSSLEELPRGAIIGTTSLRRKMQLLCMRSDLVIKDLRGNIQTRINRLKSGDFDAILLANAGVIRLGIKSDIKYSIEIPKEIVIPAMGQAALGIEVKKGNRFESLVKELNDEDTFIETTIERDFIRELNGGCQVPIGVNATLIGQRVLLNAIVGLSDGSEFIKESLEAKKSDYQKMGKTLAQIMIEKGALELLKKCIEF